MREHETLGDLVTGDDEVRMLDGLLGPGWQSVPVEEGVAALLEADAREAARFEQVKAERVEESRFRRAVVAAMRERGATFGCEVYDEVARELYGRHTPLTRRVIAEVERFARGEGEDG